MYITKRFKDDNGVVTAYEVEDRGHKVRLNANVVQSLFSQIENADLRDDGTYIAKKGSHIETVIEYKQLLVPTNKKVVESIVEPNMIFDYYGKNFINICRKIREYANQGKFTVEKKPHKPNGGKNLHLVKLIESCNISVDTFIQSYLANIQPYSLQKFQEHTKRNNLESDSIWLCDIGYGVQLLIKLRDMDTKYPVVVSFHESNKSNSNRLGAKDFSDKKCAVIVTDKVKQTSYYMVHYQIVRGMLPLILSSKAEYYAKGVALVEFNDIKEAYDRVMKNIMEQIQINYLNITPINKNFIDTVDSSKLSFLSLGFATVNNICLLLDLYSQYSDGDSRRHLVSLAVHLLDETTPENKLEIQSALKAKYLGSQNALYLTLMDE